MRAASPNAVGVGMERDAGGSGVVAAVLKKTCVVTRGTQLTRVTSVVGAVDAVADEIQRAKSR